MCNIAQTVNVLQSVALTEGNEMVLTPTYYVFKMFREHQQNTLLGSFITSGEAGTDSDKLPQLIESASIDENGVICSTVANTSAEKSAQIKCQIADSAVSGIKAEILTGSIDSFNTFEDKYAVMTEEFTGFTVAADGFTAEIPPCSVVRFSITV